MSELSGLLKMLDHETVSPATAEKMASIRNILDSLPLSGAFTPTDLCIKFVLGVLGLKCVCSFDLPDTCQRSYCLKLLASSLHGNISFTMDVNHRLC